MKTEAEIKDLLDSLRQIERGYREAKIMFNTQAELRQRIKDLEWVLDL